MTHLKNLCIRWLPLITLVWVAIMVLSLKFRFLDAFVPGTWHGKIGLDFFSIPRSFLNLLNHKSIDDTPFMDYGPYASPYPYHPALSILAGSWLSLFRPWTSYGVFVGISLLLLCYCAYLISQQTTDPAIRRSSYFLILCSFPTYLMLWNAQMHVFTVVSITLNMVGLLKLLRRTELNPRHIHKEIFAGLLVSLFSKPTALLSLPVLLAIKETRRTAWISLVIYVLVSAAFIFLPIFNPEGMVDWAALKAQDSFSTASLKQAIRLDNLFHWRNLLLWQPAFIDAKNPEMFSLPTFVNDLVRSGVNPMVYKLPVMTAVGVSLCVLRVRRQEDRILLGLIAAILLTYAHYVSYNTVWEYHYTTLLPTIPVLMLLLRRHNTPLDRSLLKLSLFMSIFFYLPTLFFLVRDSPVEHLVLGRLLRVIPACVIFVALLALLFSKTKQAFSRMPQGLDGDGSGCGSC